MMTHLLSFGVAVQDVIAMATANPARAARRDDLGRLQAGEVGDATVLHIEEGDFTIHDVDGRSRQTERRLVAEGVVRSGSYTPIVA